MQIPAYISERIRRVPPSLCSSIVVKESTPVIAFGDSRAASVATLGLNPSRVEFLDRSGSVLTGRSRRLETLHSLGLVNLPVASDEQVALVLESCNRYFCRNPYRRWFDPLENILNTVDASYYDGSACHLDLVQWATDPVWGKLPSKLQQVLIEDDASFLMQQLENEKIELLLLNGKGVIDGFGRVYGKPLKLDSEIAGRRFPTCFYTGLIRPNILAIGWSTNLQSSFGVTNELRARIACRVAEIKDQWIAHGVLGA